MTNKITNKQLEEYLLLKTLLTRITEEIKELSKKKQDGVLNPYKVEKINSILSRILDLVKNEPIAAFLQILDSDDLPTNSDSVLMLVQYQAALSEFDFKYIERDGWGNRIK